MQTVDELAFDFARLKKNGAIAAVLLLIGAGLLGVASYLHDRELAYSQQLENQLRTTRETLSRERAISGAIDTYQADFVDLVGQGYFRDDHKLNWLESVRQIGERMQLASIQYDLGQRQQLSDEEVPHHTSLRIFATPVDLRLGLLHEGDIVSIIEQFRHAGLGLFKLEQCDMSRVMDTLPINTDEALINAHCTFKSYNFEFDHGDTPDPFDDGFAASDGLF